MPSPGHTPSRRALCHSPRRPEASSGKRSARVAGAARVRLHVVRICQSLDVSQGSWNSRRGLAIHDQTTWRPASSRGRANGIGRAAATASSLVLAAGLVLGTGCGGASTTVVKTRTVDASSAAAARAAAAAQIAAAEQAASKAGQAPSATVPARSAAPTSTSGSAATKPARQKALSGVLADADAICVRRNGELSALSAKGGGQQASARRASIEERALGELAALRPPRSAARAYKQMLEDSRIALGRASKGNDHGQLRLLFAALRVGAKHCAAVG